MAFENLETVSEAIVTFLDDDNRECGRMVLHDSPKKSLLQLSEDERFFEDNDFEYEFAEVQLLEGRSYFFELEIIEAGYEFDFEQSSLLHKIKDTCGTLQLDNHTGLLQLYLQKDDNPGERAYALMEVQSIKAGSLRDYRKMISDIAEKCNDLLLQMQAPSLGSFESDDTHDAETLTQRFYFLRSLLESEEFKNAIARILRNPHIRSEGEEVEKRLSRGGFRIGYKEARQIVSRNPRIPVPANHPISGRGGLATLPENVITIEHRDNTDIPENRFVRFALHSFENILDDIKSKLSEKEKGWLPVIGEITLLQNRLGDILSHGLFKTLSNLTQLPLSSPVLQRKEGYRDILRIWLQLELSARIVWKGGRELFKGGLRDVATLYEYWAFFKLVESVNSVFEMKGLPADENGKEFISVTEDGLGLQLKAGKQLQYQGTYSKDGVDSAMLNVMFCYNRTFRGNTRHDYTMEGSWTKHMRPDYTISLWPGYIKDPKDAEEAEKIVHIHFDAKYRIVNPCAAESVPDIVSLFQNHDGSVDDEVFGADGDDKTQEDELEEEAKSERAGIASKRADLLKMHAYRDAIKRTEGAYILYPGSPDKIVGWQGFHELLPGIGAFPICPGSAEDMSAVEQFLRDSADLCVDRFSQLHRQRYWRHNIIAETPPARYGIELSSSHRKPKADDDVLCGFIRKENVEKCEKHLFFYFHAMKSGEFHFFPYEKDRCWFIPFNSDDGWLGWYADIQSIALIQHGELESMGFKLHSTKKEMPIYYAVRFKPDTVTRFGKPPSVSLPSRPGLPYFKAWGDMWSASLPR